MDCDEPYSPSIHSPASYAICYEATGEQTAGIPQPVIETEVTTVHQEVSDPDSVIQLTHTYPDTVSSNCVIGDQFIDVDNAVLLSDNCIIELNGTKHILRIDHDARRVTAVPLRTLPTEPPLAQAPSQTEAVVDKGTFDTVALASLLGRRGRGRPRKQKDDGPPPLISLLLLSPAPSPTLLVQLPIEDVPPSLPLSSLCERVLATVLSRQDDGPTARFDVTTGEGDELTLNASIAVFDCAPDWVESVVVLPLDKGDPIEDKDYLKERAAEPIQDVQLSCPLCGYESYYEAQLSEHLVQHHANADDSEAAVLQRCTKCDLNLADRQALIEHYSRRHPTLVCVPCGVIVEQQYLMRKHNERHDTVTPNRCELCGKIYKDRYILRSHIKLVHGQADVFYQCEVCRKQFERKAHLVRHMRIHSDDVKPFACSQCPYRARERGDLNKHLRGHGEPSYHCGHCEKSFTHLKSLRLHEKRHVGVRDYRCALCDFSAFTYNNVRRHIERSHATDVGSTTEPLAET